MALTLTATIDADDNVIAVTGTVPGNVATGFLFSLENEILRLKGFQGVLPPFPYPVNKQSWRVERGVNGTVAASHVSTTELFAVRDAWVKAANLTPPGPFPASGASTASEVEVSPAVEGETFVQGALEALAALAWSTVSTQLSRTQIQALNSNPITLVAGVAGKAIFPMWALLHLNYINAGYLPNTPFFGDGTNLTMGDGNSIFAQTLQATADTTAFWFNTGTFTVDSAIVGAALKVFDGGGNPTGDGGTLDITVAYLMVTV